MRALMVMPMTIILAAAIVDPGSLTSVGQVLVDKPPTGIIQALMSWART